MGSKRNKELEAREKQAAAQYQTALTAAQQPTEAESIQMQRSRDFLNWMKTPGKDIGSAPDLAPYLQIGKAAQERAGRQRMGTGAMQLGGNEGYAAKLREQFAAEQGQQFGTGLENAVTARYGEAMGSLLPLAQLGQSRQLGVLGSTQGREMGYLNAPRETPFWKQFVIEGMKGASQVAAGAAQGAAMASDERLKDNIEESPYGLKTVKRLAPKRYDIDGRKEVGFLAQDVEKIAPEMTTEDSNGTKGIYYQNMVPILTSAIKELKQEVDTIKRPKRKKKG
jgi:hypothetical protein